MLLCASLLLFSGLSQAENQAPSAAIETPDSRVASPAAQAAGQLIVRFENPTSITEAAKQLDGTPFVVDRALMPQIDMFLVLLGEESMSLAEAIARLEQLPAIRYAVPDVFVEERQTTPNDPSFGQQWGLHNTGATGGLADADIDAPEAWDLGTGSRDYVIAIVDGGAQHDHQDLLANRWENDAEVNGTAGVDDDGNGYIDDLYGWNAYSNNGSIPSSSHGTHVAGIAGARGNNGIGVAGVNWDCELMHIAGSSSSTSTVIAAYTYALTQRDLWVSTGGVKGANVVAVNSSFGIDYADCNSPTYQPWNDAYNLMGASGILNQAATINSSIDVDVNGDVPTGCSSPWMISVTNTDYYDYKAWAGYGATTIDLGAPGSSVLSTVPSNSYASYSGTSMSTPHVTGAVAFLHSVASPAFRSYFASAPDQAALLLKDILLTNVDPLPSLAGITVSGGRLNLYEAALAIRNWGSGTSYCTAGVNSTGNAEEISSAGGTSVSANTFTLTASGGVPGQFGLFFYGPNQLQLPFGDGFRCVGGGTARLNPAALSDGGGNSSRWLDLTQPPASAGPNAITPGSTWNFQHWYRDPAGPGGTGFNLSNGLEVTFGA